MKKTPITIQFDQEKVRALQFYAGKKSSSLDAELEKYVRVLYEKYVPQQTREYIESVTSGPKSGGIGGKGKEVKE